MIVIGDVHGEFHRYFRTIKEADYSLQLGDMGFFYEPLTIAKIDPEKHKFFGGNHDNYDLYSESPHALGDFGEEELGGVKFFYVRGAFSIDKKYRDFGVSWWPEEELNREQFDAAMELYVAAKPEIMITHECPREISDLIGNPNVLREFGFDPSRFTTKTSEALQRMFEAHQPKHWIFGHFHKNWETEVNGTHFQCLNEMSTVRL